LCAYYKLCISICNRYSARLIVLLSHYFYTYSPRHLRHLPCHGTVFLFSVESSPCLFLGVIASRMFTLRDHHSVCFCPDFSSELEANDDHLATNSTVIITVSVGSLLTKLHTVKIYFCVTVDFRISRVTTLVHLSDALTWVLYF